MVRLRSPSALSPKIVKDWAKMFLVSHRMLRGIVLGLMFFLAGTACCWSDSYDPDPFDDIPPVVTVEFNYVVPSPVTVNASRIQVKAPQRIAVAFDQLQDIAIPQRFLQNHASSQLGQSATDLVIPLRR